MLKAIKKTYVEVELLSVRNNVERIKAFKRE